MSNDKMKEYWSKNISKVLTLLGVWFLVSYVFGILLVDTLNTIPLGGFKLGFWFAQQGAIYTFVALIWIYVRQMNKLDEEYGVNE